MTMLSERVERLREQREHWHCSRHPEAILPEDGDYRWCRHCVNGDRADRKRCTDYHGDPREAYLNALALAWEIAPLVSVVSVVWAGLIQEELDDLATYAQENTMTDPNAMTADEIEELVKNYQCYLSAPLPKIREECAEAGAFFLKHGRDVFALRLASVLRYVEELEREIRQTHVNHCIPDYSERNMHASDCLLYALEAQQ